MENCAKVVLQGRDVDGFEASVLNAIASRSLDGNVLVFVRAQGSPGLLTYAVPNMDVEESSGVTALRGVMAAVTSRVSERNRLLLRILL